MPTWVRSFKANPTQTNLTILKQQNSLTKQKLQTKFLVSKLSATFTTPENTYEIHVRTSSERQELP
jgi:hypothetical protein